MEQGLKAKETKYRAIFSPAKGSRFGKEIRGSEMIDGTKNCSRG